MKKFPVRLLGVLLLASVAAHGQAAGPTFSDGTGAAGISYNNVCGAPLEQKGWLSEGMGSGAAWLDYDGDGNLDLYLVNGSAYDRKPEQGEANQLYRGDGKGRFTDVTARSAAGDRGWGYGVAVGDYDNDGDPDLYVTNLGANVLYRNQGDGTFEDVTATAGVGDTRFSTSAAFFDMDLDGDLDLYVANYMVADPEIVPRKGSPAAVAADCSYRGIPVACGPLGQKPQHDVLYRNDGDGTFTDVSDAAGVTLKTPRFALGVVTADYDNDGDQDIYVANDSVVNSLWQNEGGGAFTDVGVVRLCALNADGRAQAGMGTDFGDYNGDGWIDLVVTNFSQDYNTVYRNMAGRFFLDDSAQLGMGATQLALSWGVGFHDFELDGDLDLFIANGHIYPEVDAHDLGNSFRQKNHLFVNEQGRFREVGAAAGKGLAVARSFRGAAFGDPDNDGDVDVMLTALQEPGLYLRNDTPRAGHFLMIRLVGTTSNRDGVGARVTLVAGGVPRMRERKGGGSYLSANDPRLHFGLGAATTAQLIEVRWPSGIRDRLQNIPVDRIITIREGEQQPNP